MEESDIYERGGYITYEPSRVEYTIYDDWSTCDMYTCAVNTSAGELGALKDFYLSMNGDFWRNNQNWNVGDPCTNQWYGVTCNTKGNIIVLHFFENHMEGILPYTFPNLIYLKHLTLANDARENELIPNPHRSTIYYWDSTIMKQMTSLQEINMQHLMMYGPLKDSFLNLVNLRYLNLGYNNLSGPITDSSAWGNLIYLKSIELMSNRIGGLMPTYWNSLPSLEYIDISYNNFTGPIVTLKAS